MMTKKRAMKLAELMLEKEGRAFMASFVKGDFGMKRGCVGCGGSEHVEGCTLQKAVMEALKR